MALEMQMVRIRHDSMRYVVYYSEFLSCGYLSALSVTHRLSYRAVICTFACGSNLNLGPVNALLKRSLYDKTSCSMDLSAQDVAWVVIGVAVPIEGVVSAETESLGPCVICAAAWGGMLHFIVG
jgi:hypothetical protein